MYEVNEICKNGESLALTTYGQLRIVFIGTGSAFAKRRRQSNMLVIQGNHHVLIDCGTQGPLALNDLGLDVLDVRCYLPTHSHADHIGGLEEVALLNRYTPDISKPDMIILRDYQEILWAKSLSGGCEYCETNQGRSLQLPDFFNILRPENIQVEGRKFRTYKHGPIEFVIMRTRHTPDSAISVDESQWCFGILINRRAWISGDTMFDAGYPIRFSNLAEVMFHDTQLYSGGVHASYEELMTLPDEVRKKMYLYHYGDNWDKPEIWAGGSDKYTGEPVKDGFLGWTEQAMAYDFY